MVTPTTNTFQVAATVGGAAIALTTNGTGTMIYGNVIVDGNGAETIDDGTASATKTIVTQGRIVMRTTGTGWNTPNKTKTTNSYSVNQTLTSANMEVKVTNTTGVAIMTLPATAVALPHLIEISKTGSGGTARIAPPAGQSILTNSGAVPFIDLTAQYSSASFAYSAGLGWVRV